MQSVNIIGASEMLGVSDTYLYVLASNYKKTYKKYPVWYDNSGGDKSTIKIDVKWFYNKADEKVKKVNLAHDLYYKLIEIGVNDATQAKYMSKMSCRTEQVWHNFMTYGMWTHGETDGLIPKVNYKLEEYIQYAKELLFKYEV